MSREYSFSHRLGRWLERAGFTDDPFALYEADQERPYLPYFFVDRPYLHDVLGDPARPQAAFLMARRGEGKTATREMVAYECAHARLRRRALAVRYYDFSPLLEQIGGDPTQISARHHVRTIARYTLGALVEDVPSTYFDLLNEQERALLMSCAVEFAAPTSRLELSRILQVEPVSLEWSALSPLETLKTLAGLVVRLGQAPDARYQAMYVLVDRVDETSAGPEAAVSLLKPLVSQGPLLEMAHVAFKFFLPIEVGTQLRQAVTLRPDRFCIQTVTWDAIALRKMVQQRLAYYGEGRVERLEDLCTSGAAASVMERLIRACEGSPRTLLRLCRALIYRHVSHADETSTLIAPKELLDTLSEFDYTLELERTQPVPAAVARTAPLAPTEPPTSGLYLDESGHVWVDGQPLASPLSRMEFRLLEVLYRQSPEILSHEALIETVWPSSDWMSSESAPGVDEQNLRKLIARLRERLPGESSRFIRSVRGRGYWLSRT
jgi:DNA-binding response OmpR family regulator